MSAGTITKVPSGGIQFQEGVEEGGVTGTTTTMYVAYDDGKVKSFTSAGVLADLSAHAVRLNGRPTNLVYTGVSGSQLVAILHDGSIWGFNTDGSNLHLITKLNEGVAGAYYYNNLLYVFLKGTQQSKSSCVSVTMS